MKLYRRVRSQNRGSWVCQRQLDYCQVPDTCISHVFHSSHVYIASFLKILLHNANAAFFLGHPVWLWFEYYEDFEFSHSQRMNLWPNFSAIDLCLFQLLMSEAKKLLYLGFNWVSSWQQESHCPFVSSGQFLDPKDLKIWLDSQSIKVWILPSKKKIHTFFWRLP